MKRILSQALLAILFLTESFAQTGESLSNSVFQKHQPAVEASVERALTYLAANQSAEGTFNDSYGRSVGVVSLVGMAFLSAGHTPGYGPYSENLDRCLAYVLDSQRPNGLLDKGDSGHGLMYAHTIAALFLSECSGMVPPDIQERLDEVLRIEQDALEREVRAAEASDDSGRRAAGLETGGRGRYSPLSPARTLR